MWEQHLLLVARLPITKILAPAAFNLDLDQRGAPASRKIWTGNGQRAQPVAQNRQNRNRQLVKLKQKTCKTAKGRTDKLADTDWATVWAMRCPKQKTGTGRRNKKVTMFLKKKCQPALKDHLHFWNQPICRPKHFNNSKNCNSEECIENKTLLASSPEAKTRIGATP